MKLPLIVAAMMAAVGPAAAAEVSVPIESRTGLALTLYSDGLALISDSRTVSLPEQGGSVAFEGVSREMLPSSARISAAEGVQLTSAIYDFALLSPEALLRRAVGGEVGVMHFHPTSGERITEWGTLLSVDGGPLVKLGNQVISASPSDIAVRDVPDGLRARPALVMSLTGRQSGPLSLQYLTRGLGWSADYVAMWTESAGEMELTGRATLENTSGADYANARVSLVAGTINRIMTPSPAPMADGQVRMAMGAKMAAAPEQQSFSDLHLYTVREPVSLADQQTKQILLTGPVKLAVTRTYESEGSVFAQSVGGEPRATHPEVRLQFTNKAAGGESVPLPAGVLRLYAPSRDGVVRLLGEDRLDHTPVGAEAKLSPGKAFDITVTRRQTDFVRSGLADKAFETAWRIEVRNAKDVPVTVMITERVPGEATILAESVPHEKGEANRLVWPVKVAAGGSAELTYRLRVQP